MRCVDVNVLVYAHRPESPSHERFRAWLDEARCGLEPLGLSDPVLTGFVRIVTHPRVFSDPTPTRIALDFVDELVASPAAVRVTPGERLWRIFTQLCAKADVAGNLVPDAYLAALVIEQGAEWVTADRGFARFPGLRWRHPLDD